MQRRQFLQSAGILGGLAVTGTGALVNLSGSADAGVADIVSGDVTISNDRGEVTEVHADPSWELVWSGFDDAVGKIFWLVEASVNGGEFSPVYRATPWLGKDQIGTSGSFVRGQSPDGVGIITLVDGEGKPDYESIDWSASGRTSYETFMDGTSMGSASAYDGLGFQNNFPEADAGYYGAAGLASEFDNTEDGTMASGTITLRYSFELQRPNVSQLYYIVREADNEDLTDQQVIDRATDLISGLQESDIDAGNSKLVMNGEDGYPSFETPSGLTYSEVRANTGHPGLMSTTSTLTVNAENTVSDGDTDGDTNGGGS